MAYRLERGRRSGRRSGGAVKTDMKVLLTFVIVVTSVGLAAQQPAAPSVALARVPGSWVVELTTSGGFSGRGRGSLTVASDGTTRCVGREACPARIAVDIIDTVTRQLATLRTAGWDLTAAGDTCRDCYQTTMTVRTRQRDGGEAISVFKWTDIGLKKAPDDVRGLYDAAMRAARF